MKIGNFGFRTLILTTLTFATFGAIAQTSPKGFACVYSGRRQSKRIYSSLLVVPRPADPGENLDPDELPFLISATFSSLMTAPGTSLTYYDDQGQAVTGSDAHTLSPTKYGCKVSPDNGTIIDCEALETVVLHDLFTQVDHRFHGTSYPDDVQSTQKIERTVEGSLTQMIFKFRILTNRGGPLGINPEMIFAAQDCKTLP